MRRALPDFLPGRFVIEPGTRADYHSLACFHYRHRHPRTWAAIWVVRYVPAGASVASDRRVVAVGVLSWPTAVNGGRDVAFGLRGLRYGEKIRFANAHVRTISRVIVHPQFRSLGLASAIVRCVCEHCPTRYVEASAQMGRAHPLFAAAGMRLVAGTLPGKPLYYLFDRHPSLEGTQHDEARDADASTDRATEQHDQADRAGAGGDGDATGAVPAVAGDPGGTQGPPPAAPHAGDVP